MADISKELDIAVHTLSHFPDMNNSLKMEVGIEDCLHIEFEYNKAKWVSVASTLVHDISLRSVSSIKHGSQYKLT